MTRCQSKTKSGLHKFSYLAHHLVIYEMENLVLMTKETHIHAHNEEFFVPVASFAQRYITDDCHNIMNYKYVVFKFIRKVISYNI